MYRFAGRPALWEYYKDHYKLMLTYDYLQHMGYNPIYCDIKFPHPLRIRTTHGVEAYIAYRNLYQSWRNGGSGTYVTEIRDWLNTNNIMQGEFITKIVPDIIVNAKIVGGELNWDPANIPIEEPEPEPDPPIVEPGPDPPIVEPEPDPPIVELETQAEIIARAKALAKAQALARQQLIQKPIVDKPKLKAGQLPSGNGKVEQHQAGFLKTIQNMPRSSMYVVATLLIGTGIYLIPKFMKKR